MTEPRTEAGRRLAARAKTQAWSNWEGIATFDIPAIEAEAAAGPRNVPRHRSTDAGHDGSKSYGVCRQCLALAKASE